MKKIILTVLISAFGLVMISCDEDDDDDPVVVVPTSNYVIFDGETYELGNSDSYITDYGSDGTHYNYDFVFYNADETVRLYVELYSLGTSGFQGGSFSNGLDGTSGSYWDDDNLTINGSSYAATSGSVSVSETGTNTFSIDFDYQTTSGSYEGNYTGTFINDGIFRLSKDK